MFNTIHLGNERWERKDVGTRAKVFDFNGDGKKERRKFVRKKGLREKVENFPLPSRVHELDDFTSG